MSSETLFDYARRTIEAAFQCKVFMWYGTAEMSGNIVECEQGRYHGRMEHSLLEVVDRNGVPAIEGRLICTAFGNRTFPLIRYDVGDEVRLASKQSCPCGRAGLVFERVIGRVEDYIVTPEGRLVGRLDHLFKDALHVREAQLVQASPEEVIIRIVPDPGYENSSDRTIVETEARIRLGPRIRLCFEEVEKLQRTAQGKTPFIVSSLGQSNPDLF